MAGLTYVLAAPLLAGHGFCADDPRLMTQLNKATLSLMSELIPVGGMATYDVVAVGTQLLLPPELENAIEVEVMGTGSVNGSRDVRQGWYDLVNQFVYVDPSLAHDNPLVDMFLEQDSGDPTKLRRRYDYPGLTPGATVRVTGAKRYIPVALGTDSLLVQNVVALEMEIQSLNKYQYGEPELGEKYHASAVKLLMDEVKKHQLDPRNTMKRKAAYDADMANYLEHDLGYVRARLAHEIPGGLLIGKSELTRIVEVAEQRLMSKGLFVGCLEEFSASVL